MRTVHRRRGMRGGRGRVHRRRRMGRAFKHRRAVRCRGWRMLDWGRRVLDRSGRVLDRGRLVLDRGRRVSRGLCRLVDHRCACAAVAGEVPAGALAPLKNGAGIRRRCPMATNRAGGAAATLDDRPLPSGTGRAVQSRDATAVHGTTAERSTFLPEYLAVGSSTSSGQGAARSSVDSCSAANTSPGAQPSPTRYRLRSRVAPQRGAVAAQDIGGTFAADAQPCAACGTGARLTTDADTR
jgi:hypothetical protein